MRTCIASQFITAVRYGSTTTPGRIIIVIQSNIYIAENAKIVTSSGKVKIYVGVVPVIIVAPFYAILTALI